MYFYDNGIKISESDLKEALAYSDPYLFLGREIFKCIQDVMQKKLKLMQHMLLDWLYLIDHLTKYRKSM